MANNMNREQKRMLQRAGYLGEDGEVQRTRATPAQTAPKRERTSPRRFVREMVAELRKVAWPTRSEVVNYSIITLVFLVVVTAVIGVVDWGFARAVFWLFAID